MAGIFAILLLTVVSLAGAACARRTAPLGSSTMPDPGGCYVLVHEQPQFLGSREFVNGPAKYPTLTELPFRANWRRRIRSVRVGAGATVTVWTDEAFQGSLMTLRADSSYPILPEAFSAEIESLQVACAGSAQAQPADNAAIEPGR